MYLQKYRLWRESDETISHIASECKKLAKWQKNKVRSENLSCRINDLFISYLVSNQARLNTYFKSVSIEAEFSEKYVESNHVPRFLRSLARKNFRALFLK